MMKTLFVYSSLVALTALGTGLAIAGEKCSLMNASSSVAFASATEEESKDIVDTAVAAGKFKTLVTAVKAANLVETLKGDGPFTVFAPTDEAFAALPEGTVEALLQDTEKLKAILLFHVVKGKVMAGDVVKLDSAKTVGGKSVNIKVSGDNVMVGPAKVVKTDIATSNGVIHVIDKVLIPPTE